MSPSLVLEYLSASLHHISFSFYLGYEVTYFLVSAQPYHSFANLTLISSYTSTISQLHNLLNTDLQNTPPSSKSPHILTTTKMAPPRPASWTSTHDAFVKSLARNGEDARSILILLESEYPSLAGKVSEGWVRSRM